MTDVPLPLQVESLLKTNRGECEGNQAKCGAIACPLYGTLGRVARDGGRRVRGCADPVARGKRNRSKGDSKARKARRVLAISGLNTRHEELLGGALRVEFKAGKQVAPPVTAYLKCEAQSEQARPFGDARPFAAVWLPDGSSDGVVAFRLSKAYEVAAALLENLGGEAS